MRFVRIIKTVVIKILDLKKKKKKPNWKYSSRRETALISRERPRPYSVPTLYALFTP